MRRSLFRFCTPVECHLNVSATGLARIVIDRPAKKNALGRVLLNQLQANIRACHNDSAVRCVVINSAVKNIFCAGADLKERKEMTPQEAEAFVNQLRSTFTEFEKLPMPTIAVVDGFALGGGLELALAADLRVASARSTLGVPETSLAIIPGAGGTQRLSRVIGLPRAKQMVFTAKPIKGDRAEEIGLVNVCVKDCPEDLAGEPSAEPLRSAIQLAEQICTNGPIALRQAKRALTEGLETTMAGGMQIEQECYAEILKTKDRLEGLKAFAEKRKPVYKGE